MAFPRCFCPTKFLAIVRCLGNLSFGHEMMMNTMWSILPCTVLCIMFEKTNVSPLFLSESENTPFTSFVCLDILSALGQFTSTNILQNYMRRLRYRAKENFYRPKMPIRSNSIYRTCSWPVPHHPQYVVPISPSKSKPPKEWLQKNKKFSR